jgi:hypothetical protein
MKRKQTMRWEDDSESFFGGRPPSFHRPIFKCVLWDSVSACFQFACLGAFPAVADTEQQKIML